LSALAKEIGNLCKKNANKGLVFAKKVVLLQSQNKGA
jgi:hypothetical protein